MLVRDRHPVTAEVEEQFHGSVVDGMQMDGAARELWKLFQRNPCQEVLGPFDYSVGRALGIEWIGLCSPTDVNSVLRIESMHDDFVQLAPNPVVGGAWARPRRDGAIERRVAVGVEREGGGLAVLVHYPRSAFGLLHRSKHIRHSAVGRRIQRGPRHSMDERDVSNQLLDGPVRHGRDVGADVVQRHRPHPRAFEFQHFQLTFGGHSLDRSTSDGTPAHRSARVS